MPKEYANNTEILQCAELFATGLDALRLPRGARILVRTEQHWQFVAFFWACLGRELVPVPVSPFLTERELDSFRTEIKPSFEVADLSALESLRGQTPSPFNRVPSCRVIHFTSGTTGRPKGVWSGFWSSEHAAAALAEEQTLWGFCAQDTNLVVSPLYHSAPLRFALNTVIAGGNLVVQERFDLARLNELVDTFRPTTMFCVPTQLKRMLEDLGHSNGIDFTSFRLVAHAGAPCPPTLKRQAIETIGADVLCEFYGSTEGQFTFASSSDWLKRGSGVGFARGNRTMYADSENQLWCLVPPWGTFEYFGDSARTQAIWESTPKGPAFTVGDLGRVDPDGWVHIDARRTDLIISGGVNLYPREIEAVVEAFPGVAECAVVGRPHEDWGQEAVAVIVGEVSPSELRAYLTRHLSRTKIPKDFIFLEHIPHTATGKIQRHNLLDMISDKKQG